MTLKIFKDILQQLTRIADSLEKLDGTVENSTNAIMTKDVGRAEVYSEHLGKKLRP